MGLSPTRSPAVAQATVWVVDDDWTLCRDIAALVESAGFEAAAFLSAEEFLAAYSRDLVACLILDLRLPGASGTELHRRLRESGDPPPIVYLTAYGTIPVTVEAIRDGAVDFLEKPLNPRTLINAVRRAVALDADFRQAADLRRLFRARFERLTAREREVFEYVISGKPNRLIAEALAISEHTTKIHRGRVMAKMKADSVAALLVMAQHLDIEPRLPVVEPERLTADQPPLEESGPDKAASDVA